MGSRGPLEEPTAHQVLAHLIISSAQEGLDEVVGCSKLRFTLEVQVKCALPRLVCCPAHLPDFHHLRQRQNTLLWPSGHHKNEVTICAFRIIYRAHTHECPLLPCISSRIYADAFRKMLTRTYQLLELQDRTCSICSKLSPSVEFSRLCNSHRKRLEPM